MKYRFYVDEVGSSDLGASHDPNHRYLSLTGIILGLEYVGAVVFPALEAMKRVYFGSHPDEPVILHRKELVNKQPPFENLRNPEIEQAFNQELLSCFCLWDYAVITVVFDKLEHQQRYEQWRFDPYHYCLAILTEQYVGWLRHQDAVGDVMAESRGGNEDRRLKDAFAEVCAMGSQFVTTDQFTAYLTSRQLKVKTKSHNIAGLQLADLIAHPSFRASLARRHGLALPANFGGQIAEILESNKYHRSPQGAIDGWGRRWLP